ncbi:hypothetical protein EV363DRAFT_1416829 [Boletus edulis]|nr:hypothetical protein EV363DRAFT_1416829 [Boletus edulis]
MEESPSTFDSDMAIVPKHQPRPELPTYKRKPKEATSTEIGDDVAIIAEVRQREAVWNGEVMEMDSAQDEDGLTTANCHPLQLLSWLHLPFCYRIYLIPYEGKVAPAGIRYEIINCTVNSVHVKLQVTFRDLSRQRPSEQDTYDDRSLPKAAKSRMVDVSHGSARKTLLCPSKNPELAWFWLGNTRPAYIRSKRSLLANTGCLGLDQTAASRDISDDYDHVGPNSETELLVDGSYTSSVSRKIALHYELGSY